MALTMTLADSLQLTTDTLQAGVIETLGQESKILAVLPFMDIQGSGYSYNVEKELSNTKFRAVGEAIDAGHAGWETRTEALKILGDEAIIDTFQIATYGNITDLMSLEVGLKVKAMAHKFEKTFISGDKTVNANEFDGIDVRIADGQTKEVESITAEALDELIDAIQGTPSALVMNKTARRKFTAAYREFIDKRVNDFGVQVSTYGGIDIIDLESEVLESEEVVYAVKFAPKEGVCGLTNGGVQVKSLGEVDNAPQLKTRIEWFVGLAVFNDKAIAKATVTAP